MNTINCAFKIRAYPTQDQRRLFARTKGARAGLSTIDGLSISGLLMNPSRPEVIRVEGSAHPISKGASPRTNRGLDEARTECLKPPRSRQARHGRRGQIDRRGFQDGSSPFQGKVIKVEAPEWIRFRGQLIRSDQIKNWPVQKAINLKIGILVLERLD